MSNAWRWLLDHPVFLAGIGFILRRVIIWCSTHLRARLLKASDGIREDIVILAIDGKRRTDWPKNYRRQRNAMWWLYALYPSEKEENQRAFEEALRTYHNSADRLKVSDEEMAAATKARNVEEASHALEPIKAKNDERSSLVNAMRQKSMLRDAPSIAEKTEKEPAE